MPKCRTDNRQRILERWEQARLLLACRGWVYDRPGRFPTPSLRSVTLHNSPATNDAMFPAVAAENIDRGYEAPDRRAWSLGLCGAIHISHSEIKICDASAKPIKAPPAITT